MSFRLLGLVCGLGATLVACSIVNQPDDPVTPGPSSSSVGGQGGDGGSGATGGEGGSGGMPAVCGDGVKDGDEECDEGGETASCNADCSDQACGDGVVNRAAAEECDDGNSAMGDACSTDCTATVFDIDAGALLSANGVLGAGIGAMVTTDNNGEEQFFVMWPQQKNTSNNLTGITSAVYTVNGDKVGTDSNVSTNNDNDGPSLAYNNAGLGLAVWRGGPPLFPELRYRLINADGTPAGNGQSVLPAAAPRDKPVAAAGPDGGFCVYWADNGNDVGRVRCVDDLGNPVGNLEAIDDTSNDSDATTFGPAFLFAVNAGYLLGYNNKANEARGQVLSPAGVKLGGPFVLWDTLDSGFGKGFGNANNNAFVAAGFTRVDVGGSTSTRAVMRRFTSAGNPMAPEVLLGNVHTDEVGTHLTRRADGGPILASWSRQSAMSQCHLVVRLYQSDGMPVGSEKVVVEPGPNACPVFATGVANTAGDVFLPFVQLEADGSGRVRALIYRRLLEDPAR